VVHVDPVPQAEESLAQTVGAIAAQLGLRTHNVHAHEVRGRYYVDLHVEVPADLTLDQAHDRVSRLELALRDELPEMRDIHSHIEPISEPAVPVVALDAREEEELRAQIVALAGEIPGLRGYSGLQIRSGPDGYEVTFNCLADPELSVTQAHRLADEVEKQLRARIPGVSQVLVHLEPEVEI